VSVSPLLSRTQLDAIQRRTLGTLVLTQIFTAMGYGSITALGSILAVDLSGTEALAGATTTATTLAPALLAVPLSTLSMRYGRRVALAAALGAASAGTLLVVGAVVGRAFPLLVLGSFLLGFSVAVNLQARFAAADLARPERRGRDLSLVVWAVTLGAVAGPNMVTPGAWLAGLLGLPAEAGAFVISGASIALGGVILAVGLRPDPLLVRNSLEADRKGAAATTSRRPLRAGWNAVMEADRARAALALLLVAHTVMVGVMSMTPLHLQHLLPARDTAMTAIGITISLHVVGMYALSPLMGWAADRFGRGRTALLGTGVLLGAAAMTVVVPATSIATAIALFAVGVGWSAITIAASALLIEAVEPTQSVAAQGLSDALMSAAGAAGSLVAGTLMGWVGFQGLNVVAGLLVIAAAGYAGAHLRGRRAVEEGEPRPQRP
jgi:MFS family permease